MADTTRITGQDCLAEWRDELTQRATTLRFYDADQCEAWINEATQLLAAVADAPQCTAWTLQMAQALSCRGVPEILTYCMLRERTEQRRLP